MKLLYIDLFCGAGGTSTGVESARVSGKQCAKVIACVNHDANAIASHAANHPDALHFTEDIRSLELSPLVDHVKRMRSQYSEAHIVLWASLECTNFSKAKGGQSRDADSRTLAEHLFRYIEAINPDYVQIENVEEFMSWGDMDENGKPISMDKGKSYQRWVCNVKKYGYDFDYRVLNAADFGAYTSRKRFFGQFAKYGLPIVWPEPTHSKNQKQTLFGSLQKWKAVKDVLDFSDEGVSIFTRKKPLSEKTLERIYAGLIKFVAGGKDKWMHTIKCKDNHSLISPKFLAAYYGNGDNVSRIDMPCPTVPTKDRFNYVSPKFLCSYNFKDTGKPINAPCPTLLTKDRLSLINPKFFMNYYSGGGQHSDINNPSPAILATPKQRHYLMNPQFTSHGSSVNDPCFTLIARMDKRPPHIVSLNTVFSLDTPPDFVKIDTFGNVFIEVYEDDSPMTRKIKEFMFVYEIIDILMRMLKILELLRIMGFPHDYKLIGTQADQKKFIGNAVEVTMARVLCETTAKAIKLLTEAA